MKVNTFIIRFLASGGFISYLPAKLTGFKKFTGSGFAGTLLAVALVPFLPQDRAVFAAFCLAFLPFSIWIASLAAAGYGTDDDPRIVIDEMIGYWTAILFMERTPLNLAAAFIIFRAIDTFKPWPIKKLEIVCKGGFGIIIDDVLAGAEANLLARLAVKLFI